MRTYLSPVLETFTSNNYLITMHDEEQTLPVISADAPAAENAPAEAPAEGLPEAPGAPESDLEEGKDEVID